MLRCIQEKITDMSISTQVWTSVYGLARSLIGLSTLLTLLFNGAEVLFRPAAGIASYPLCHGIAKASIFCLVPPDYYYLNLVRWLCIFVLVIVISGWRPRITGLFHWWISFSLQSSAITLDGGDQVNAVLSLILLPVCFTDHRRWHWDVDGSDRSSVAETLKKMVAIPSLWVARLQVAGIYLHAAVGKLFVQEWVDGTAMYYWLTDPILGPPSWLKGLFWPIVSSKWVVVPTWGAIVLELLLFLSLAAPVVWRCRALVVGIAFHCLIAMMFGIITFSISMTAALILYLVPWERNLAGDLLKRFARGAQLGPVARAEDLRPA